MEFNFKLFSNKFTGSISMKLWKVMGGFGDLRVFKAIYQSLSLTIMEIYHVLNPNCFYKLSTMLPCVKKLNLEFLPSSPT